MQEDSDFPEPQKLMNAMLVSLHRLGGSANRSELKSQAVDYLLENGMPRSVLDIPFIGKRGGDHQSKVRYRLNWALTNIKLLGLAENLKRGVWSLTRKGMDTHTINAGHLARLTKVRRKRREDRRRNQEASQEENGAPEEAENTAGSWQDELLDILRNLPPDAFERLCQRILRASDFTQVKVTGKSGDGGIDGQGIIRIGGLISFPVLFQCKRYSGSVGPGIVRDFRGAMVGRASKGLILTTGYFSQEALKEATREGAEPIDLLDGDTLPDKIRELGLGVKIVEAVEVQRDWFEAI